jgi:hypothetical protein
MRLLGVAALLVLPAVGAGAQEPVEIGTGAVLRGLDKIAGGAEDIELANGGQAQLGPLTVELGECRYPEDDPAADAFAFVTIRDPEQAQPLFSGWMIASSPALNALEHPRYDLWVLRCKTE